jgi:hypothetical protein
MALPGQPVIDHAVEVQMLFRRILSPTQQSEKERHQRGKRSEPRKNLPKAASQG